MRKVTNREKREFVERCKVLARRDGVRVKYYPARWVHELLGDLRIQYQPDEAVFYVRLRMTTPNTGGEYWPEVVRELLTKFKWGHVHRIHHHLKLMQQMMLLDDLADA